MANTADFSIDETRPALDRITKPAAKTKKTSFWRRWINKHLAREQANIDRKYKMMRETGYDQAWHNRRQADKWMPALGIALAIIAALLLIGMICGIVHMISVALS